MQVKDIKGFEGLYTVDECGNVYSIRSHKYLKQKYDRYGYKTVHLCNNRNDKFPTVHKLVAEAFIPNDDPLNKTTIDHIDANKDNNCVNNLRWMTASENTSIANKRRDCTYMYKPVKAINVKTHQEYIFNSYMECADFIHGTNTDIWSVLKGKQKTARGYYFEEIKK
jgi:hypothetical protein